MFHSFFQTGGKVVEELLEFRYHTNIGIKLTNVSSLRCSDAMNCSVMQKKRNGSVIYVKTVLLYLH